MPTSVKNRWMCDCGHIKFPTTKSVCVQLSELNRTWAERSMRAWSRLICRSKLHEFVLASCSACKCSRTFTLSPEVKHDQGQNFSLQRSWHWTMSHYTLFTSNCLEHYSSYILVLFASLFIVISFWISYSSNVDSSFHYNSGASCCTSLFLVYWFISCLGNTVHFNTP